MIDLRPKIGVEANMLRKYLHKKTGTIRYSKTPVINISSPSLYTCRETLSHTVKDDIGNNTCNNRVDNNPYKLYPLIATSAKGRLLLGESNIVMELNSIHSIEFFRDNNARQQVLKGFNYILDIMGVCFSNPKEERIRLDNCGKSNNYSSHKLLSSSVIRFEYRGLSSFWLVSPVMLSIMTGMARNVLSVVYDRKVNIDKYLFDKIPHSEIKNIIHKQDRTSALSVYKNILVPFFERYCSGNDDNYEGEAIFLGCKKTRRVIDKLINNGCYSVFKPDKCTSNWLEYDDHYGLFDFMDELGSPSNDSHWDRFR